MSGLGEVLAGVAAVASVSQLLVYVLQMSQTLATFYNEMENAPSEINRVQQRLAMLHSGLAFFKASLTDLTDEAILPLELKTLLESALRKVYNIIIEMQQKCLKKVDKEPHRFGSRFRFAWRDHASTVKLLNQLQEAEMDLLWFTQLLNIRVSLLSHASIRAISASGENKDTAAKSNNTTNSREIFHTASRVRNYKKKPSTSLKNPPTGKVLSMDSWLRKLGFYCAINFSTSIDDDQSLELMIGFKFPILVTHKAICLYLHFIRFGCSTINISILPGFIRVQNQVSVDSPFMKACATGDTLLISQYLKEDPELVNNRTICSGKTPLLLAIKSNNLGSIKCLLEAGADPNMGDDERILPVFASLGYRDKAARPTRRLVQFAPNTTIWLEMLQLLVRYGASVHEIMAGKTMTTLSYTRESYDPETTVRYFQLLLAESYVDFNVFDNDLGQCSALWNAIRSWQFSAPAIDILAQTGVQLNKVFPNGRNALHMAAEMGFDAEALMHLYSNHGVTELNRQDQWGWTPLHYAVASYSYQYRHCAKVRFLLEKGADPHLKGANTFRGDHHPSEMYSEPISPLEYAGTLMPHVYRRFSDDMRATGTWPLTKEGEEVDVFFDTYEDTSLFYFSCR